MLDRIITQSDLLALVEEMARKRRIIGPVARSVPESSPPVRYFYEEVDQVGRLDLGFSYCVYGPKRFLVPSDETLFKFAKAGRAGEETTSRAEAAPGGFSAEPVLDDRPMALVGVHPCDIHAISLLDRVFTQKHRDEHYLARRENTLIIGIDCAKPCTDGVFCKDTESNSASLGFDVMLYPLGVADGDAAGELRYGAVFGSPAGREWLLYSRRGSVPSAADERQLADYEAAKNGAFRYALRTRKNDLPDLLARSYDSLLWEATARRCYSCGSCNLSCPTCYCFNMYDETDLSMEAGERHREWDACHLPGFALVAGEHNFRPKAASRLRHRIYRKAAWIEQNTGVGGCVGCARCDRACTAKISSVEIYNQLAEEV